MKRLFVVNALFLGLSASWTTSAQDTPAMKTIAAVATSHEGAASPLGMLLTGLVVMAAIALRRMRAAPYSY